MKREQHVAARFGRVAEGFEGLANFETTGHEHKHIAPGTGTNVGGEGVGGQFPRRWRIGAKATWEVLDVDGEIAAFGGQDAAVE
jgi:hypothetical protein